LLDAPAALELLLNTANGAPVRHRVRDPGETLHAPHLLSIEVAQVFRRYVQAKSITPEAANTALEDLVALDIERYELEPLLGRVWELRENLTAYDAVYVALSEVLSCPLLTFDARIAGSQGHGAVVEVLG